jgi:DNA-directed RNA polymerase specialized sigma24 family protein
MQSEPASVSLWLQQLQAGDHAAAEELWQRYCTRLVVLARSKIRGLPCRVADEEDVALSAFDSFCRGAIGGRFPSLDDRNNLWRLLVTITARKAYQHGLRLRRQKRGGKAVLDEAALAALTGWDDERRSLEQLVSREPTPEFAAQAAEEYQRLLGSLPKRNLRVLAQWKMEGFTNKELAAKLACSVRSVERKLRMIRGFWEADSTWRKGHLVLAPTTLAIFVDHCGEAAEIAAVASAAHDRITLTRGPPVAGKVAAGVDGRVAGAVDVVDDLDRAEDERPRGGRAVDRGRDASAVCSKVAGKFEAKLGGYRGR